MSRPPSIAELELRTDAAAVKLSDRAFHVDDRDSDGSPQTNSSADNKANANSNSRKAAATPGTDSSSNSNNAGRAWPPLSASSGAAASSHADAAADGTLHVGLGSRTSTAGSRGGLIPGATDLFSPMVVMATREIEEEAQQFTFKLSSPPPPPPSSASASASVAANAPPPITSVPATSGGAAPKVPAKAAPATASVGSAKPSSAPAGASAGVSAGMSASGLRAAGARPVLAGPPPLPAAAATAPAATVSLKPPQSPTTLATSPQHLQLQQQLRAPMALSPSAAAPPLPPPLSARNSTAALPSLQPPFAGGSPYASVSAGMPAAFGRATTLPAPPLPAGAALPHGRPAAAASMHSLASVGGAGNSNSNGNKVFVSTGAQLTPGAITSAATKPSVRPLITPQMRPTGAALSSKPLMLSHSVGAGPALSPSGSNGGLGGTPVSPAVPGLSPAAGSPGSQFPPQSAAMSPPAPYSAAMHRATTIAPVPGASPGALAAGPPLGLTRRDYRTPGAAAAAASPSLQPPVAMPQQTVTFAPSVTGGLGGVPSLRRAQPRAAGSAYARVSSMGSSAAAAAAVTNALSPAMPPVIPPALAPALTAATALTAAATLTGTLSMPTSAMAPSLASGILAAAGLAGSSAASAAASNVNLSSNSNASGAADAGLAKPVHIPAVGVRSAASAPFPAASVPSAMPAAALTAARTAIAPQTQAQPQPPYDAPAVPPVSAATANAATVAAAALAAAANISGASAAAASASASAGNAAAAAVPELKTLSPAEVVMWLRTLKCPESLCMHVYMAGISGALLAQAECLDDLDFIPYRLWRKEVLAALATRLRAERGEPEPEPEPEHAVAFAAAMAQRQLQRMEMELQKRPSALHMPAGYGATAAASAPAGGGGDAPVLLPPAPSHAYTIGAPVPAVAPGAALPPTAATTAATSPIPVASPVASSVALAGPAAVGVSAFAAPPLTAPATSATLSHPHAHAHAHAHGHGHLQGQGLKPAALGTHSSVLTPRRDATAAASASAATAGLCKEPAAAIGSGGASVAVTAAAVRGVPGGASHASLSPPVPVSVISAVSIHSGHSSASMVPPGTAPAAAATAAHTGAKALQKHAIFHSASGMPAGGGIEFTDFRRTVSAGSVGSLGSVQDSPDAGESTATASTAAVTPPTTASARVAAAETAGDSNICSSNASSGSSTASASTTTVATGSSGDGAIVDTVENDAVHVSCSGPFVAAARTGLDASLPLSAADGFAGRRGSDAARPALPASSSVHVVAVGIDEEEEGAADTKPIVELPDDDTSVTSTTHVALLPDMSAPEHQPQYVQQYHQQMLQQQQQQHASSAAMFSSSSLSSSLSSLSSSFAGAVSSSSSLAVPLSLPLPHRSDANNYNGSTYLVDPHSQSSAAAGGSSAANMLVIHDSQQQQPQPFVWPTTNALSTNTVSGPKFTQSNGQLYVIKSTGASGSAADHANRQRLAHEMRFYRRFRDPQCKVALEALFQAELALANANDTKQLQIPEKVLPVVAAEECDSSGPQLRLAYAKGGTLEAWLRQAYLSIDSLLRRRQGEPSKAEKEAVRRTWLYLWHMARAVYVLHACTGVVHGDVALRNCLLTETEGESDRAARGGGGGEDDMTVVLCDFEHARIHGGTTLPAIDRLPPECAPEITWAYECRDAQDTGLPGDCEFVAEPADWASDVYSLGQIMLGLLSVDKRLMSATHMLRSTLPRTRDDAYNALPKYFKLLMETCRSAVHPTPDRRCALRCIVSLLESISDAVTELTTEEELKSNSSMREVNNYVFPPSFTPPNLEDDYD